MKKPKRRGYVPSRNVRNHIYKWEASDIKAQNKKFGGDAIKAKAAEFNAMLGDYATRIGQDTADALFSTYYNISPNTFKERILPSVIDYAKNSTKENYNKVHDIMMNRYTWADKKYQRGIKKRAAADAALAKPIIEINYDDVVNDALEQPIDALRVETPKIIKPIKIKSTPIIQQEQEQVPIYLQKPEILPNIIDTWNNVQKENPLQIPQFKGGKDSIILDTINYNKYKESLPKNLRSDDINYNLYEAYKINMKPELQEDGTYHLGSRNPYNGKILKSTFHPTFSKAIYEDMKMGYYPQYNNGDIYTQKIFQYEDGKDSLWNEYSKFNDSALSIPVKFLDPTGISSWKDAYDAWTSENLNIPDAIFETVGAIPLIGKIAKIGKAAKLLSKDKQLFKTQDYILRGIGTSHDVQQQIKKHNNGKDSEIHIKKANVGKFTNAAKQHGMSVQQFANKVLKAPKGKYSSTLRKRANFARNAKNFNH